MNTPEKPQLPEPTNPHFKASPGKGEEEMKRWLKKYGKRLIIILGILFIANSTYWLFHASSELMLIWHVALIMVWSVVVLASSGALWALVKWWDKD